MGYDVTLPELGEDIEAGEVTKVMVSPGDTVEEGQTILELETGKATVEVPSPAAGTVSEVKVEAGREINVGDVVLVLDDSGGAQTPGDEPEQPEPETDAGEAETEQAGEPAAEADEEVPAEADEEAPAAEEPEAEPAADEEEPEPKPPAEPADAPEERRKPDDEGSPKTLVPAAPSVRRFARQLGVDVNEVTGSGPHGRVSIDDVKGHVKQRVAQRPSAAPPQAPELPDFEKWGEIDRRPMSTIRRRTAQHMAVSWSTIPQVTHHDEADITELEELRKRFKDRVEKAGGKLTITPILAKVVASALGVFPDLNASIDTVNDDVIYKSYRNLGIAVDTDNGLLVPVVKNCQDKNMVDLAVEIVELSDKARDGKLSPDEMAGGTFTITNLGGIGGTGFSPIVNHPEVAILGVSRAKLTPGFGGDDGLCRPRLMLPLSLTYDHRLVDGAEAARFLRWVAEALEEPLLLSLEG